jgi:hypothetical protein
MNSRPVPNEEDTKSPRRVKARANGQLDPPTALLEAYKKHVEELRGIEDRQNKTIALILGIFSAAGTLLIAKQGDIPLPPKLYVTFVAVALVWIGQHAVDELHDLRIAVRGLLVRCETALGFYQTDKFFQGEMLYTTGEQEYALGKGAWMKQNYRIVWGVSTAFLVLLWLKELTCLKKLFAIG